MFHLALFASISALLLTDATAKPKSKQKSDLTLLVDLQTRWKTFWNKAAIDVAVNKCMKNCQWKDLKEEESQLRIETVDLVMHHPEFEASVAEFLALSHRGASPKEHGMQCQAARATSKDDYCVCAQDIEVDWVLQCSLSSDKKNCHAFLNSMCGLVFHNDEGDEVIDDFEDLEDTEGRLHNAHTRGIGEVEKEQPSKTEKQLLEQPSKTEEQLLRLQAALGNLDAERQELFEVHAESKKSNPAARPFLSSIDKRIKRQKDQILRNMEEIVNRREKEIAKEKEEADLAEKDYQKRLKALMEGEFDAGQSKSRRRRPKMEETGSSTTAFCQVGRGEKGKAFKNSGDNSQSKCQALCSSTSGCTNFDYTQKSHGNACRLYSSNTARLGDGGVDSRQYCTMELKAEPVRVAQVVDLISLSDTSTSSKKDLLSQQLLAAKQEAFKKRVAKEAPRTKVRRRRPKVAKEAPEPPQVPEAPEGMAEKEM